MSFRSLIESLQSRGKILTISRPVSRHLEAAAVLSEAAERPVLFERILESKFRVAGNLFAGKEAVAAAFGIDRSDLLRKMAHAIANPSKPRVVEHAPCQEVVEEDVDLDRLPILFHCDRDGGRYVTSGVFCTRSRDGTPNMDFHRAMQIGRDRFSIRVVAGRDFDTLLRRDGALPVAACVGNGPNVLLAAATSVRPGLDELEIANTLEPLAVTRALTFDGWIPAESEFVLEGIVHMDKRAPEGPFVDLTGTYDFVRTEPVFQVTRITHRKDAIWHALLPGRGEHKTLMGMPREPTIYREVEAAGVRCLDVHIQPGGCSWLHAVVQIEKKRPDDGRRAIEAAFRGHRSLKHAFVVDPDVNPYDPLEVEWALATRFQADKDLVLKAAEKGSSLDPSADPATSRTAKCGFDCTKPLGEESRRFEKALFPRCDLDAYVERS